MKCKKCGNEVKVKDAKFCPFCGGTIEKEEELAGYTRAQFFSYTGDSEFRKEWETVRSMTADEALAWLRQKPHAHYVYCFYAGGTFGKGYLRLVSRRCMKYLVQNKEKVFSREHKLSATLLNKIGEDVFWTKEECEAAIMDELCKKDNSDG